MPYWNRFHEWENITDSTSRENISQKDLCTLWFSEDMDLETHTPFNMCIVCGILFRFFSYCSYYCQRFYELKLTY